MVFCVSEVAAVRPSTMSCLRTQSSCAFLSDMCRPYCSDQPFFVPSRLGLKIMVAEGVGLRCRRAYPGDEMHGTAGNPDLSHKRSSSKEMCRGRTVECSRRYDTVGNPDVWR